MHNPYITDRPLDGQDLFFGRERELADLAQALAAKQPLLLLYGQRRIGKTSFLNQLPSYLGEGYFVARVAWEEIPADVDGSWNRISWAVAHALGWPEPAPGSDAAALASYLSQQQAVTVSQPRPLVCVDGIPPDCCAPGSGWAELLGALVEALREGPLSLLLAVEARPEECESCDVVPKPVVLGGLTLEETEDLLLMSTRGQLTYDLDSMRRIYNLTGGEPYLVQLFGHVLFELRAHRGWVSLAEVDAVVPAVVEQAEAQFAEVWSRSDTATRVVLCIFAEGLGTHGIGSADDIRRRLARLRVEMPLDHIQAALADLERRDLVERLGGGLFRFRSALLLQWLRENKSALETVRRSREYRRLPNPTTPPLLSRKIDWLGLGLWVIIAALIIAIGSVWRNREMRIVWTDEPPTEEPGGGPTASASLIAPTPERGLQTGRIAYMAKQDTGQYWDIYTMTSEGLDPLRLTENEADDMLPAWAPDGRSLAFVSDRDGNREVYVMEADGSRPTNLTQHPAEDWTPTWAPDGSRIAFASFRDNNWEIYVMNADGSSQRRVTNNPAADYSPVWSPDGEWIAFVSDRTGNLELFVMRPDGSDLRQFTDDPATDQSPSWSPDGRELLWESYRYGNMEILIADREGGEPRNLSQDAYADDHGPSMCPLGQRIAYFTNRDGGWDIATLDLQSGARANLTQSLMVEQYPAWAP